MNESNVIYTVFLGCHNVTVSTSIGRLLSSLSIRLGNGLIHSDFCKYFCVNISPSLGLKSSCPSCGLSVIKSGFGSCRCESRSFLSFFSGSRRLVGFFACLFHFFQWEDFHHQQQVGLGSVHRLLWILFQ